MFTINLLKVLTNNLHKNRFLRKSLLIIFDVLSINFAVFVSFALLNEQSSLGSLVISIFLLVFL